MTQDSIDLDLDALVKVARAATQGEWLAGHLHRDDHQCNCPHVLSEGYMGSICTIDVGSDLPPSEGGNDNPPLEEAKGNQLHIATFDPPTVLKLIALARDHSRDVPEGWKLVPVEPDGAMVSATWEYLTVGLVHDCRADHMAALLRAAVAAAPLPSSQGGGKP